ncbi:hypothetical protein FH972_026463 [Carpinus fangiana]|uniref:BZIP domain-containing protein n=1 Tax=Carpinus fangiana TaxID=176857 RepID=A0A5N6L6K7_9ROSI|nr:hypothetical protein FH972_026463 [Carpinus fangiana]
MAAATRTAVESIAASSENTISAEKSAASQADVPATTAEGGDNKASTTNAPLAPPPKPTQTNGDGPDYFSSQNNDPSNAANANGQGSHFSLEPNPFEQSFGNPATDTPGKFAGLPSVASLTSPAPLGPGGTPNWQGSLRSGPLSPAMLPGPTGGNGYFDQEFRGSFPTPNESSLRTGLTPGGGGSMFPAPSPNSQALYNSMASGGATPGTLDFHRTAMNAAARNKDQPANANGSLKQEYQQATQQQGQSDPFTNQPESDAVNSLYMLANNNRNANQFAVPNQPQHNINQGQMQQQRGSSQDFGHQRNQKDQSIGSLSGSGVGDYSEEDKPSTRGSKKKGSAAKGKNGRKAEETPSKQPAGKRAKGNSGMSINDMSDEDDQDDGEEQLNANGKKMTDEEKRKNFLERNRVAALKCRQRKKQWLANLQTKVEIFTSENDALSAQCTSLREEVVQLKTLLLAHKDCPISHQQGLGGNAMAQVMGDFNPQNPYGMMGHGQMQMGMQPGQGMQRRRADCRVAECVEGGFTPVDRLRVSSLQCYSRRCETQQAGVQQK